MEVEIKATAGERDKFNFLMRQRNCVNVTGDGGGEDAPVQNVKLTYENLSPHCGFWSCVDLNEFYVKLRELNHKFTLFLALLEFGDNHNDFTNQISQHTKENFNAKYQEIDGLIKDDKEISFKQIKNVFKKATGWAKKQYNDNDTNEIINEQQLTLESDDLDNVQIFFCSKDILNEFLIIYKNMVKLSNHWGWGKVVTPTRPSQSAAEKYDENNKTHSNLLHTILSLNLSTMYPSSIYCYNGGEKPITISGKQTKRYQEETTTFKYESIFKVLFIKNKSDKIRGFEYNSSNGWAAGDAQDLINQIKIFVKLRLAIQEAKIVKDIKDILKESIVKLKFKIDRIISATYNPCTPLPLPPPPTFGEIVEKVLGLLHDETTPTKLPHNLTCSKLKSSIHQTAVAEHYKDYYGPNLARQIELLDPKPQAGAIHRELHTYKIFDSPNQATHNFYMSTGKKNKCYALDVTVDNYINPIVVGTRPQRAISNEEEHVAPASKYQALATLKNNKLPMYKFLTLLFKDKTATECVDLDKIILEEQSLLLLPSSRIFNQPKSSRDLINFEFNGGVLVSSYNTKVSKIISSCIKEIIRKGESQGINKTTGFNCAVVGKIFVDGNAELQNPNLQVEQKMNEKLNEWCIKFNSFSKVKTDINDLTNGKLIHYISVIYSFVLLTFMNKFYDDNCGDGLNFDYIEEEEDTTINDFRKNNDNWDQQIIKTFETIKAQNPQIYLLALFSKHALKPKSGGSRIHKDNIMHGGLGCGEDLCDIHNDEISNKFINTLDAPPPPMTSAASEVLRRSERLDGEEITKAGYFSPYFGDQRQLTNGEPEPESGEPEPESGEPEPESEELRVLSEPSDLSDSGIELRDLSEPENQSGDQLTYVAQPGRTPYRSKKSHKTKKKTKRRKSKRRKSKRRKTTKRRKTRRKTRRKKSRKTKKR